MPIELCPYSDEWALQFLDIKAELSAALKDTEYVFIEHIGSTSIPLLTAKPIIDIDIIVSSSESVMPVCRSITTKLPYEYRGTLGIPDRHSLRHQEQTTIIQKRNVYVVVDGAIALRNHLAVRTVLRENELLRKEYQTCKEEAAATTDDVNVYMQMKSTILTKVLLAAGSLSVEEVEQVKQSNRLVSSSHKLH
jgi:GrpB-like predicted nucleotidyltransferase (UPF0157 family)